jgi:hypothetical protein
MIATASTKVKGLGHTATIAIEPRIRVHAWAIRATLFHVDRVRTSMLGHQVSSADAKYGHCYFSLPTNELSGAEFNLEPRGFGRHIGLRVEQAQHLGGKIVG